MGLTNLLPEPGSPDITPGEIDRAIAELDEEEATGVMFKEPPEGHKHITENEAEWYSGECLKRRGRNDEMQGFKLPWNQRKADRILKARSDCGYCAEKVRNYGI